VSQRIWPRARHPRRSAQPPRARSTPLRRGSDGCA